MLVVRHVHIQYIKRDRCLKLKSGENIINIAIGWLCSMVKRKDSEGWRWNDTISNKYSASDMKKGYEQNR